MLHIQTPLHVPCERVGGVEGAGGAIEAAAIPAVGDTAVQRYLRGVFDTAAVRDMTEAELRDALVDDRAPGAGDKQPLPPPLPQQQPPSPPPPLFRGAAPAVGMGVVTAVLVDMLAQDAMLPASVTTAAGTAAATSSAVAAAASASTAALEFEWQEGASLGEDSEFTSVFPSAR